MGIKDNSDNEEAEEEQNSDDEEVISTEEKPINGETNNGPRIEKVIRNIHVDDAGKKEKIKKQEDSIEDIVETTDYPRISSAIRPIAPSLELRNNPPLETEIQNTPISLNEQVSEQITYGPPVTSDYNLNNYQTQNYQQSSLNSEQGYPKIIPIQQNISPSLTQDFSSIRQTSTTNVRLTPSDILHTANSQNQEYPQYEVKSVDRIKRKRRLD